MSHHKGSNFDDFLAEEGILEEVSESAEKRFFAWQLRRAMEHEGVSEAELARRMETSRSSVRRLFSDAVPSVTLQTMRKAARCLHRHVAILLLDPAQVNETTRKITAVINGEDPATAKGKRAGRATRTTRTASAKDKRGARPAKRRRTASSTSKS